MAHGLFRFQDIIQVHSNQEEPYWSLLEVRGDTIFLQAFSKPREHVSAKRCFALDETRINSGSPLLTEYSANRGVPLSLVDAHRYVHLCLSCEEMLPFKRLCCCNVASRWSWMLPHLLPQMMCWLHQSRIRNNLTNPGSIL